MNPLKACLLSLGEQVERGYEIGSRFLPPDHYRRARNILFCGMGGSAIGGDILRELVVSDSSIPFVVSRNFTLPKWVNRQTLAIFSSYSGNTWETRAVLKSAVRLGAKVVVLTSGGYFLDYAVKRKIPYILIPGGLPPRQAIGYLTFSLMPLLRRGGWLKVSRQDVRKVSEMIRGFRPSQARRIAKQLVGRCVYFYGTSGLMESVARRWKAQLAENSKTLASYHSMPEMYHNEIEGWRYPEFAMKHTAVCFLADHNEPGTLQRKRKLAERVIRGKGASVLEITAPPLGEIPRTFALIYLGDWVSYELAMLNGVDPIPIPVIEEIKRKK